MSSHRQNLWSTRAVAPKERSRTMDSRDESKPAKRRQRKPPTLHHNVYVVYLRNPKGDGKAAYYVGMTGLTPEQRFENHRNGIKAARIVRRCGERLVPKLYAHLNPMPYAKAQEMEVFLAESLRKRGFVVYGGH